MGYILQFTITGPVFDIFYEIDYIQKKLTSVSIRDVVLGTCTCTRVVLKYKSRVLVLVLVLEG